MSFTEIDFEFNNTEIELDQSGLTVNNDMTLILGARCSDGVVLAADRKLSSISTSGIQYQYGDKITGELSGVLTAFSGDAGAFQVFSMTLKDYVSTTKREQKLEAFRQPFIPGRHFEEFGPTIDQMKIKVSQIQDDFFKKNDKYRCRILMAISSIHARDELSSLFLFEPDGRSTPIIEPTAIGTGSPYAAYFLKRYSRHNETTMHQFAQLADFIIRYVSHDERPLDNSVGLDNQHAVYQYPQIFYVPDRPNEHCPLDEFGNQRLDCVSTVDELCEFQHNSANMLRSLDDIHAPWPDG
jgi:20S proteasome alpha/beta subunit